MMGYMTFAQFRKGRISPVMIDESTFHEELNDTYWWREDTYGSTYLKMKSDVLDPFVIDISKLGRDNTFQQIPEGNLRQLYGTVWYRTTDPRYESGCSEMNPDDTTIEKIVFTKSNRENKETMYKSIRLRCVRILCSLPPNESLWAYCSIEGRGEVYQYMKIEKIEHAVTPDRIVSDITPNYLCFFTDKEMDTKLTLETLCYRQYSWCNLGYT